MAHLPGFILDNFRVFSSQTKFDFAPINILTGANSSGKSSLIKALLLLKENSNNKTFPNSLAFNHDSHKLGSFEYVLNDKDKKMVAFGIPFRFPEIILEENKGLSEDWRILLEYDTDDLINHPNPTLTSITIAENRSGAIALKIPLTENPFYIPFEMGAKNPSISPLCNLEIFYYSRTIPINPYFHFFRILDVHKHLSIQNIPYIHHYLFSSDKQESILFHLNLIPVLGALSHLYQKMGLII